MIELVLGKSRKSSHNGDWDKGEEASDSVVAEHHLLSEYYPPLPRNPTPAATELLEEARSNPVELRKWIQDRAEIDSTRHCRYEILHRWIRARSGNVSIL